MRHTRRVIWLLCIAGAALLLVRACGRIHYKGICFRHLVELGVDIRMYAGKHAGRYPERLSDLVGAVFGDRAVFDQLTVCPASRKPYAHYAGLTDSDPPSAPLAFDLPGNHPGGGYVLFADGHVSWCGEEFLARLLKGAQGCVATGVWNSGTEVEIAVDRRRADEVEGRMRLEEGP